MRPTAIAARRAAMKTPTVVRPVMRRVGGWEGTSSRDRRSYSVGGGTAGDELPSPVPRSTVPTLPPEHHLRPRVHEPPVVPERRRPRPREDPVPVVERVLVGEDVEQVPRTERPPDATEAVAALEVHERLGAEELVARVAGPRGRVEFAVVRASRERVGAAARIVGRERPARVRP